MVSHGTNTCPDCKTKTQCRCMLHGKIKTADLYRKCQTNRTTRKESTDE